MGGGSEANLSHGAVAAMAREEGLQPLWPVLQVADAPQLGGPAGPGR
ncbi:hypothetical protein ACP4OV_029268 [Aristida adscensionis]